MNSLRASTRRAALAAFLLFAAALLVVGPAEASRTTDARSSLVSSSSRELASLELSLLEPLVLADTSPRFGFAEDLSLLDVEARPCGFELFGGVETNRCALTYARNNPVNVTDPDGRLAWVGIKATVSRWLGIKAKDLTKPGPYAVKAVPGTASRNLRVSARRELRENFDRYGCHTCGTKIAGTRSGNPVGDHQPPIALNSDGRSFELFPQCASCSAKQGWQVSNKLRTIAEFVPAISGFMMTLGLLEAGEDVARSTGDAIEQRVLESNSYQQLQEREKLLQQTDE